MHNTKKYGTITYILRAQPLHKGHIETIKNAGLLADNVVIIIGSSFRPRDYKNPFTYDERKDMVLNAIQELELNKITGSKFWVYPLRDTLYDDTAWVANVQRIVFKHANPKEHIAIIGHEKDESSFYLKMFPTWKFEEQSLVEPLDATQIRQMYFTENSNTNFFSSVIAPSTRSFLDEFKNTNEFKQIIRERRFIENYKKQFSTLQYEPTFVTTDAVVVQSGHILLVKRRAEPGNGLYALPGGFMNAQSDKSIKSAMIRNLMEKTKIKLPEKVLLGNIKKEHVFDAKSRSSRGRTITHASFISLNDGEWNLPKVTDAEFVPLSQLSSENMFEDHYDIIEFFLGNIPNQ